MLSSAFLKLDFEEIRLATSIFSSVSKTFMRTNIGEHWDNCLPLHV